MGAQIRCATEPPALPRNSCLTSANVERGRESTRQQASDQPSAKSNTESEKLSDLGGRN
jgi:hypothetical protein